MEVAAPSRGARRGMKPVGGRGEGATVHDKASPCLAWRAAQPSPPPMPGTCQGRGSLWRPPPANPTSDSPTHPAGDILDGPSGEPRGGGIVVCAGRERREQDCAYSVLCPPGGLGVGAEHPGTGADKGGLRDKTQGTS